MIRLLLMTVMAGLIFSALGLIALSALVRYADRRTDWNEHP